MEKGYFFKEDEVFEIKSNKDLMRENDTEQKFSSPPVYF